MSSQESQIAQPSPAGLVDLPGGEGEEGMGAKTSKASLAPAKRTEQVLTLPLPDDGHLHVRDGERLAEVVPHSAAQFGRAIIMPNLKPPVTTVAQALAYRQRIRQALGSVRTSVVSEGQGKRAAAGGTVNRETAMDLAAVRRGAEQSFEPMMTLYLTPTTTQEEVRTAAAEPAIVGIKLYPAGATTHSDAGVAQIAAAYPVFAAMERFGVPLLIHGEVTDPAVDVFDREAVFIERHLIPLRQTFPGLKVVLEHITTEAAVSYVEASPAGIGATITAHHLLYNRNALFQGGLRPHWYCLPVLKRERHRQALLGAIRSGNPRFFLGTDSAPHDRGAKEADCGCAGCYTAWHAMPLYAWAFEQAQALDRLPAFAGHFAADFYGWPRSMATLTLRREAITVPALVAPELVPLAAGETLPWRIEGRSDELEHA